MGIYEYLSATLKWGLTESWGNHLPDRFNLNSIPQHQLWNAEMPASQSVCGEKLTSTRFVIWTCGCIWGGKTTYTERPVLRNDPRQVSPFSHGMCDQLSGQLRVTRMKPDTFHVFRAHDLVKAPGLGFGLPWAGLVVGWNPATVPPNSVHSDKSHRAHTAASSGVYRSPPHDGCTATRGYSETSRGRCE